MRDSDKRKRLPQRWAAMADYHQNAAALCRRISDAKKRGAPTLWLRNNLRGVEKRGSKHRHALMVADPGDAGMVR